MKTVVILAGLVAIAFAANVPFQPDLPEFKQVDEVFATRQMQVLVLLAYFKQVTPEAEWYKTGHDYDVEANIDNYTNKTAVEEFLHLYKTGFLPKYKVFSIFYERMREEAIALFHLFYYAKDFDTFYKTAAWARVYLNEYQFVYSFYIAVQHRQDTQDFVLPAPYELNPEFFTNTETMYKVYRGKMQDGIHLPEVAHNYGIVKENDFYVFYANYSNYWTYDNDEHRLSYFTEDIGVNSFYYYFHTHFPFWMEGGRYPLMKDRRGERYYNVYQNVMARYYLERLSNGLGEIPEFTWWKPIKYGYTPFMSTLYYPFIQRNNYYTIPADKYYEELQFLETYEKTFTQYLQRGHFKAYNQDVDFYKSKSINFVGNFWQSSADLYEHSGPRNFFRSYEITARHLLGAGPEPLDKYTVPPYALNFYQTSMRDPMFYQMYNKILKYIMQYKEYLEPYTQETLLYPGVKINDVHFDKLVTYFDFYDYDITNGIYRNTEEFKTITPRYKVRQPRLNHKPFTFTFDVKSDVEGEAVFKVFLGPKYDSKGYPINIEDNHMNFYQLDWFSYKLKSGQNKIERHSKDFHYYKEDSLTITDIFKYLKQGKVPLDMSQHFYYFPNRMMLPKGTDGGFPYQLFVFVYPYDAPSEDYKKFGFIDKKPFGYPFDRPVYEPYFHQPNAYFKDVHVYFEGEHFPYSMNNPFYVHDKNFVPKN